MKNLIKHLWVSLCFTALVTGAYSQVNYSANNTVPGYSGTFNYGTNPGYYPPFNDKQNADLALAAGVHSTRPALYDWFLAQYGLSIRTAEFAYYGGTLGMRDLTLFLSDPSPTHKENTLYGTCTIPSLMFKNMYAPIWDGGTNGTAVNDTNYFARYVFDVIKNYGTYIKFYEIWNEPDFTYNTYIANAGTTVGGNWWQNNPDPCDLTNTRAPIFQYIRLLRIAYEVIKFYQPSAFITTGGIGYSSYLDALLRNTDNPVDGSVTSQYPLKGGAYFDVLSYHSYPQYATRYWSNANGGGFVYSRHSDSAVDTVFSFKRQLEKILTNRGYNGITYPKKHVIITETNIPRRTYPGGDQIGSAVAQRNFVVKTMVKAQKEGVKQVYTFTLGDSKDSSASTADGFDMMGLYLNLNTATPSTAKLSPSGIAHKTLSSQIYGFKYDSLKTAKLFLPSSINGAAFSKSSSKDVYVLWARTKTDQSETASAIFKFPTTLSVTGITSRSWDFSKTNATTTLLGNTITLTGSPVFLSLIQQTSTTGITTTWDDETIKTASMVFPNPFSEELQIALPYAIYPDLSIYLIDSQGKIYRSFESVATGHELRLSTTDIPKGVYALEIRSSIGKEVLKVVKID